MPKHPNFFLGAHLLRVREHQSQTYLPLGRFDGAHDVLAEFEKFCQLLSSQHQTAKAESVMWKVDNHERRSDRVTHCGTVEMGDFGYRSRLINVDSGSNSFTRRPSDAELIPMFFLLNAPPKSDTGIVLLQKHGIRSSYSFFNDAFRNHFGQLFRDYRLELHSFVTQATLDAFRHGVVRRITLISKDLPSDIADRVNVRVPPDVPVLFEQVIRFPTKQSVPMPSWIAKHFRKGTSDPDEGVMGLPRGVEAAKVTVKGFGGRERTIELGAAEDMVPYVDITHEVKVEDGHPNYESIRDYALNFADEVAQEVRGDS
jgi:hypothetical protein